MVQDGRTLYNVRARSDRRREAEGEKLYKARQLGCRREAEKETAATGSTG